MQHFKSCITVPPHWEELLHFLLVCDFFCCCCLLQNAQNLSASRDIVDDRPKSHPPGVLTTIPLESDLAGFSGEFLSDSQSTDTTDSLLFEYGQCALRGYLFKKERFMTWVKLYCIIRNNFLECHKIHGDVFSPMLKLFLPGSEIKEGGGDAKKKWAFQVI